MLFILTTVLLANELVNNDVKLVVSATNAVFAVIVVTLNMFGAAMFNLQKT